MQIVIRQRSRLKRLAALIVGLALSPSVIAAGGSQLYFIRGLDRGDGMTVNINLQAGYLLITSDLFDAIPCAEAGGRLCFSSGYMSFAAPPEDGVAQWSELGYQFVATGACTVSIARTRVQATRIVSQQNNIRFEFYFDTAAQRLLGWRADHRDHENKPAHDLWMAKGLKRCKPLK